MNSSKYNLVLYEQNMLSNFIQAMAINKGKNISQVKYAYILHDKDIIQDTGELKKPHYHLYIEFPSQVKSNVIDSLLVSVGGNASMRSNEVTNRNFLAYLTHSTDYAKEIKKSYDYESIVTNWSQEEFKEIYYEALTKANKPSRQKQKVEQTANYFEQAYNILKDNSEIVSYSTFVWFLTEQKEYEMLEYTISHAYAVKEAFKEHFRLNNYKYQRDHLESEVRANIEENRHRLVELGKQKIKTEQQSDKIDLIEQFKNERNYE